MPVMPAIGFDLEEQIVATSDGMLARGERPDRQLPAGGEKGKSLK